MKGSLEKFIEKAKVVHTGENLDYSEVVYVNNRTKVKIIDHDLRPDGTEYGAFWQTPSNHLKGQAHPDKRATRISASKKCSQDDIIKRFKEVHPDENLDYSQVEYVNMHTKVKIISHDLRPDGTEYGEFWQEPIVHLKGCTHPDIGKEKQNTSIRYTTEKFIEIAKRVHGLEHYSYDKTVYKGSKIKVCIKCNAIGGDGKPHGYFNISPDAFLQGKGCPVCGNHASHAEVEITNELIKELGNENVIVRDKCALNGLEMDIYIPNRNVGIEFDGLRWHSDKFNKNKNYHFNKSTVAYNSGIKLVHVFEDEFLYHKDIVIDKLKNILGINASKKTAYARCCTIHKMDNKSEVSDFLNKYHIQGDSKNNVAYGAYYNGILVGVMTFSLVEGCWILNRFCTNIEYRCPGVASRLFKHFVCDYNPEKVKSFLDRRWCFSSDDNLYVKLGFSLDGVLKPDYRYTNGHGERKHKFGFRKQILHKKYGFPMTMTEREMTKELGYDRIWDCGLFRYVWTKEKTQG